MANDINPETVIRIWVSRAALATATALILLVALLLLLSGGSGSLGADLRSLGLGIAASTVVVLLTIALRPGVFGSTEHVVSGASRKELIQEFVEATRAPYPLSPTAPPEPAKWGIDSSNDHLPGDWICYWLSFTAEQRNVPQWMEGVEHINPISNSRFEGNLRTVSHPNAPQLQYTIAGEIRAGHMVSIDYCDQADEGYSIHYFRDILPGSRLLGIWVGPDNNRNPIAAPIILSKAYMTREELTAALRGYPLGFVAPGDYAKYVASEPQRSNQH